MMLFFRNTNTGVPHRYFQTHLSLRCGQVRNMHEDFPRMRELDRVADQIIHHLA